MPDYFLEFLELCVMITADHGPAVSGAHNTIVSARAGKDLVSSLISGLCTIVSVSLLSCLAGFLYELYLLSQRNLKWLRYDQGAIELMQKSEQLAFH